ncbi:hypothetical protein [Anoxybacteroides rupiense]|uniref:hypothetical protein n=1 Tax=Anoxybacteroides rupiense TaxID=311460 RepID=UPI0016061E4F|nr:hypothetical protein [Anoxybacillus rupiensis]MBB3908955.1 hypothetical protein [Anoxybacillus rupiensis]
MATNNGLSTQRERLREQLVALSQSLTATSLSNRGIDVSAMLDLLGINFNVSIGTSSSSLLSPNGLAQYLNNEIAVTTPSEVISGTLIAIQTNYIVMVEFDGSLVLIPIDKIEAVTEI